MRSRLAALALGTFLAQFIFIAMLCALPILLLAMAVSSRSESVARGLIKIGYKAMVAKVVFLLVLGLLAELIVLVDGLVNTAGNGFGVVFLTAVAPLLAFYALHAVLRQVGMQGMLSIRGSILTTAGFATGHNRADKTPRHPSRFERLENKGRQLGTRAMRGRGPDPSRPGGARPPGSGTRKNPNLYPKGGGAGSTPGSPGASPPGGTTPGAAGALNGPRGGVPASTAGSAGAPTPVVQSGKRGVAGVVGSTASGVQSKFEAFRSPQAVAARTQARSRAYHMGLGLLAMAPGRGALLAGGTAGAVAHVQRAKVAARDRGAKVATAVRSRAGQIGDPIRASIRRDNGRRATPGGKGRRTSWPRKATSGRGP